MNGISSYPTGFQGGLPQKYRDLTFEQKKAWYDSEYDEFGNILALKEENRAQFQEELIADLENAGGKNFDPLSGHAIMKVGEDYVVISLSPTAKNGRGNELTPEIVEYLQGKYDMNNLTYEDRIKLLAELSCFGIISGNDVYEAAFPKNRSGDARAREEAELDDVAADAKALMEHYLLKARQSKEDMSRISADRFTGIAYVESQRQSAEFYSTLASTFGQL